MEENFNTTPMRPLREVLAEFEQMIDTEQSTSNEVCEKCHGTNTELIRDEQGRVIGARRCGH